MQALIHIEVGIKPSNRYNQPIIEWAKGQFPNLTTFDFDNFSEPTIISYAIDLIRQVDIAFIIIDTAEQGNPGPLIKFMEKLIGHKNKTYLILNGKSPVLEKMGKVLGEGHFMKDKNLEEQQAAIDKTLVEG